ncbi:nucleotidyl transferase AbiEii/AbiGii toxin family protein [Dyadobacter sp. CY327]|uniref:nucleotidyl transferase AbiEii/AbiGii toxin family protein n=1 Tax=Dyadobacter sp. CY327 TaxID=2907301 RepID=UPI001F23AF85|nr:nucleotidyl transferase AbiEii/AbiGii toxin family protein [Dyadobacter sp. CY327]MCE7070739.1 nucleotidyl transferase AbiEii/AbiGii toxin family protein [Dyadobacter sp. CY327]
MLHYSTVDFETYEILKKIFSIDLIKNRFALAGGTSLSLQLGHRHSIDLDIFSPEVFDTRDLELTLSSTPCLKFEMINRTERMLFSYINNVKCDFVNEPSTLLNPFLSEDDVNYFHFEDIAAMKMHTVCGRGKKKDFFDIYVLLENYGWQDMLKWFASKYGESQYYFLWRSIAYFEDAEDDVDIVGFTPYTKDWEEIKSFIKAKCV